MSTEYKAFIVRIEQADFVKLALLDPDFLDSNGGVKYGAIQKLARRLFRDHVRGLEELATRRAAESGQQQTNS